MKHVTNHKKLLNCSYGGHADTDLCDKLGARARRWFASDLQTKSHDSHVLLVHVCGVVRSGDLFEF